MCGRNQYIVSGDDRDYCRKRISGSDRFPTYTFHCISNFTYWRTDWKCVAASGNGGKNMPYCMCDFGDGKYYTESLFIPKYGITAAAATTAVSELISLCIAISRVDKKIKLIACRKDLAGPAIGVLLIILIGKGVAIVTENLWTKTVLTILLSILGYFIVLILTRNEFAKNMSEILFGKCRHKK